METLVSVKKEQNVLTVQQAFIDFLKGNVQGILDVCTEDVTWGSYSDPAVPFSKTYAGKKGVGEFFATLAATSDYKTFATRDFYADGDTVLVKGYQEAVVKGTGKTFAHDFLMQFKLRDGKIFYFFSFIDINDEVKAFTK
jgi:ketosteroid isomerase-like protein